MVYPSPHQHSIPRTLAAVLRLLPPFPSRPGGPSGLVCMYSLDAIVSRFLRLKVIFIQALCLLKKIQILEPILEFCVDSTRKSSATFLGKFNRMKKNADSSIFHIYFQCNNSYWILLGNQVCSVVLDEACCTLRWIFFCFKARSK